MEIKDRLGIGVDRRTATFDVSNFTKTYPKKTLLYEYKKHTVKLEEGYELVKDLVVSQSPPDEIDSHHHRETSLARSLRRTKTTISDLVLCNEFDLFVTFTFKSDRFNTGLSKSKLSNWLKSQQKQYGKFTYIVVPEFHKDKKAIHFHGLFKNYAGPLSDSGVKINGRKSYNLKSYKSGFNSAVKIDNVEKVANYVRKYITKDMPQFAGKKRYWHSVGLKMPELNYNVMNIKHKATIYENEFMIISEIN